MNRCDERWRGTEARQGPSSRRIRASACGRIIVMALSAMVEPGDGRVADTPVPAPVAASARKLVVGVKESPPFVIRTETGSWSGLGIDLWVEAAENAVSVRVQGSGARRPRSTPRGGLDVVVAALSMTPERERIVDFTVP